MGSTVAFQSHSFMFITSHELAARQTFPGLLHAEFRDERATGLVRPRPAPTVRPKWNTHVISLLGDDRHASKLLTAKSTRSLPVCLSACSLVWLCLVLVLILSVSCTIPDYTIKLSLYYKSALKAGETDKSRAGLSSDEL